MLPLIIAATKSFNSQPPGGGWGFCFFVFFLCQKVSTHSRPEAAGSGSVGIKNWVARFQLTAARRRLATKFEIKSNVEVFQLTAARRRLGHRIRPLHSATGFNSQPPGGGWLRGSPSFRG